MPCCCRQLGKIWQVRAGWDDEIRHLLRELPEYPSISSLFLPSSPHYYVVCRCNYWSSQLWEAALILWCTLYSGQMHPCPSAAEYRLRKDLNCCQLSALSDQLHSLSSAGFCSDCQRQGTIIKEYVARRNNLSHLASTRSIWRREICYILSHLLQMLWNPAKAEGSRYTV